MLSIGHKAALKVHIKDPESGKLKIVSKTIQRVVTHVTEDPLDGSFGPDRDKRLVVELRHQDLIVIHPECTGHFRLNSNHRDTERNG